MVISDAYVNNVRVGFAIEIENRNRDGYEIYGVYRDLGSNMSSRFAEAIRELSSLGY